MLDPKDCKLKLVMATLAIGSIQSRWTKGQMLLMTSSSSSARVVLLFKRCLLERVVTTCKVKPNTSLHQAMKFVWVPKRFRPSASHTLSLLYQFDFAMTVMFNTALCEVKKSL